MELISDVDRVESRFSLFRDSVSVSEDRCTVCTEHTICIEIVLDTLDGTPRYEAQVEARFGLFGDSTSLDARLVHGLRRTYRRLRNNIRGTRWNS
jgi:hypothetical protein